MLGDNDTKYGKRDKSTKKTFENTKIRELKDSHIRAIKQLQYTCL